MVVSSSGEEGASCCVQLPGSKMAGSEVIKEEKMAVVSKKVKETGGGPEMTAHLICTSEGNTEKANIAAHRSDTEWVLDSGASKHVGVNFVFLSLKICILLLRRALFKLLMVQSSLSLGLAR